MIPRVPVIPFVPAGAKILQSRYDRYNLKAPFNLFREGQHGYRPSRYSSVDKEFQDWLFAEYNAEIVKHNGVVSIRFCAEDSKLMFLLKWGV